MIPRVCIALAGALIAMAAVVVAFNYHPTASQHGTSVSCGTLHRTASKEASQADISSQLRRLGEGGTQLRQLCLERVESLAIPVYSAFAFGSLLIVGALAVHWAHRRTHMT